MPCETRIEINVYGGNAFIRKCKTWQYNKHGKLSWCKSEKINDVEIFW